MASTNEDERTHCFQVLRAGLIHLPDEPAPSPTDLAQWEELVEPLRAEIVAAGIEPLRLDAIVSGVPRLLRERDELLRKAIAAPSSTKPDGAFDTSDYVIIGHDGVPRRNTTNPEGLEWCGNDLWVKVGRVRQEKPALADPDGGYWWSVLNGSETGPIVGIEPAKALTEERARSWLSPVSDADTVRVKRKIYDFLMGAGPLEGVYFGERHPDERGAFWWRSRLRASLNTGGKGNG